MIYSTNSPSNIRTFTRTECKFISFLLPRGVFAYFIALNARFLQMNISLFHMIPSMIRLIINHQIFNSIIKSISIYMMDNFGRIKFTTKMLLHNMPMFKNIISINSNYFITLKNTTTTIRGIFTDRWISVPLPSSIMNGTPTSFPFIFPISRLGATYKFTYFIHGYIISGTKINATH